MVFLFGAGDEARTRYLDLGKVALYQMSYARKRKVNCSRKHAACQPCIFIFCKNAGFNMYLDRLGQLIRACLSYYIALHGQKERLYMSANESKLYTFKEREWVVTGWAEGQMETEREDDKGQKVIVMQPYYQLFVISPVSSYKSDNYSANGMKAEKLRCVSNAVWKDLKPLEVVNLYFDEKKRVSLAASTGVSVELNEVSF